MAVPYELYIRYLATRGFDDLALVNEDLSKIGLRPITQEILDNHWDVINETMPKGLLAQIDKKIYGSDFPRYMRILEVQDLWEGLATKSVRRAIEDIHDDRAMRLTINTLLLKGLKIEEITRLINAKYSAALKETHIDLYRRFYFDPRRMRRADWKRYIASSPLKEKELFFMAMTETVDVVKTELDLPSQISVSDTLQWLITKSFNRAKTCMNVGTPESSQEARAWIDKIIQLSDKYEKYRSADQHDFAKTLQMEFDFIEDDFATPDSDMMMEMASTKAGEMDAASKT